MRGDSIKAAFALLILMALPAFGQSADRFPRPEWQQKYEEPNVGHPSPRTVIMEWVDVGMLLLMLSLASYYSLKKVSRKAIFILSVVAVSYFGFYREGCVCPIGSIQNVALGLSSN